MVALLFVDLLLGLMDERKKQQRVDALVYYEAVLSPPSHSRIPSRSQYGAPGSSKRLTDGRSYVEAL